jgi:hypothetical protein
MLDAVVFAHVWIQFLSDSRSDIVVMFCTKRLEIWIPVID